MPVRPPTFRPQGQRTRRQINAEYDARRGSARARGYDARWDREALAYKREHPLCAGCEAVGRVEQTKVVDHIIPHRGDHALMWDPSNWQPACGPHHDVVKQRLEARYAAGSLKAEDLRLDSPAAVRLTNELLS